MAPLPSLTPYSNNTLQRPAMSPTTTLTVTEASPSTSIPTRTLSSATLPSQCTLHARVVRFNNECVLIPEPQPRSRRATMLTKSYSLPLWKKKPVPMADSEALQDGTEREDTHVVFKVPLPSFKAKNRSPTRGRDAERVYQPLPSCLVHRESSVPSHPPRSTPVRRPSLTLPNTRNLVTVPLRACCTDCIHITEECLKEGEHWQEKFSRGARRRRSASLDTAVDPHLASNNGTSALCSALSAVAAAGTSFPSVLAITVDEVEKRRKSIEIDDVHGIWPQDPSEAVNHDRGGSSSSVASSSTGDEVKPPKASPIVEEDEDQLFPLPSPRRSPNGSPKVSPSHSPSISPAPSPNASTVSFRYSPLSQFDSPSHDSLPSGSGSEDSHTGTRHVMRKGRCKQGLLTPDASPSIPHYVPPSLNGLSLQHELPPTPVSSPTLPHSTPTTSIRAPTNTQPAPPPTTATTTTTTTTTSSYASPPPLRPSHSRASSSAAPAPSSWTSMSAVRRPVHTRAASSPSHPYPPTAPVSPPPSPVHTRRAPAFFSGSDSGSSSPARSPPPSPRASSWKPRTSFSLLKVGADVLKGVGSLSGVP